MFQVVLSFFAKKSLFRFIPDSITLETKFLSIFAGKLCGILGLSEKEITELADYFKMRDGRIYYKQLCDVIQGSEIGDDSGDKHFVTGLEWEDPLHKNNLSPYEYRHVCLILAKVAQNVRLRDVTLMPYFQDYELVILKKAINNYIF